MNVTLSYYDQTLTEPAAKAVRLGVGDFATLELTVCGSSGAALDMSAAVAWRGSVTVIKTGIVIARMLDSDSDIDFSAAAAGRLTIIVDCTSAVWAQQTAAGDVAARVELYGVDHDGHRIFRPRFAVTAQPVDDPVGGEKPLPADTVTLTELLAILRSGEEYQFSADGVTVITDPTGARWVRRRTRSVGGAWSDWLRLLAGEPGEAATFEIVEVITLEPDAQAEIIPAVGSAAQARKYIVKIPRGVKGDKGDVGPSVAYSPFLREGGVYDEVWGYCASLGITIDRMTIHVRQRAATAIVLEIVSADATSTGDIVVIPVIDGVDQPPVIVSVTGSVTLAVIALPGTSGVIGLRRDSTSEDDTLDGVAAAVLSWEVIHG